MADHRGHAPNQQGFLDWINYITDAAPNEEDFADLASTTFSSNNAGQSVAASRSSLTYPSRIEPQVPSRLPTQNRPPPSRFQPSYLTTRPLPHTGLQPQYLPPPYPPPGWYGPQIQTTAQHLPADSYDARLHTMPRAVYPASYAPLPQDNMFRPDDFATERSASIPTYSQPTSNSMHTSQSMIPQYQPHVSLNVANGLPAAAVNAEPSRPVRSRRARIKKLYKYVSRLHVLPPPPDDTPMIIDDGKKPPQTWEQLVGMAILRMPGRRACAEQIYMWIGRTFEYFGCRNICWHNHVKSVLMAMIKAFEMVNWDTGEALGADAEAEARNKNFSPHNFFAIKHGHEARFRGIERPEQLGIDHDACRLHLHNYRTITRVGQGKSSNSAPADLPHSQYGRYEWMLANPTAVSDGYHPSRSASQAFTTNAHHLPETHQLRPAHGAQRSEALGTAGHLETHQDRSIPTSLVYASMDRGMRRLSPAGDLPVTAPLATEDRESGLASTTGHRGPPARATTSAHRPEGVSHTIPARIGLVSNLAGDWHQGLRSATAQHVTEERVKDCRLQSSTRQRDSPEVLSPLRTDHTVLNHGIPGTESGPVVSNEYLSQSPTLQGSQALLMQPRFVQPQKPISQSKKRRLSLSVEDHQPKTEFRKYYERVDAALSLEESSQGAASSEPRRDKKARPTEGTPLVQKSTARKDLLARPNVAGPSQFQGDVRSEDTPKTALTQGKPAQTSIVSGPFPQLVPASRPCNIDVALPADVLYNLTIKTFNCNYRQYSGEIAFDTRYSLDHTTNDGELLSTIQHRAKAIAYARVKAYRSEDIVSDTVHEQLSWQVHFSNNTSVRTNADGTVRLWVDMHHGAIAMRKQLLTQWFARESWIQHDFQEEKGDLVNFITNDVRFYFYMQRDAERAQAAMVRDLNSAS